MSVLPVVADAGKSLASLNDSNCSRNQLIATTAGHLATWYTSYNDSILETQFRAFARHHHDTIETCQMLLQMVAWFRLRNPHVTAYMTTRSPIKIALAQILVEPGRLDENLTRAETRIAEAAANHADVVVLPEALDCGWTHPSARNLADTIPNGVTCARLRTAAKQHGIMVCGGIVERDANQLFNSGVLIDANGELLLRHRKINELGFARELYSTGTGLGVVDTSIGRVGLMICADAFIDGLVITRCLGAMGATIILSPCAWAIPPDRDLIAHPYGQLWRDSYAPPAREFRMVIAGCSNVGPVTAGSWSGWRCIGNSMIMGRHGTTLVEAPSGATADELVYATIAG